MSLPEGFLSRIPLSAVANPSLWLEWGEEVSIGSLHSPEMPDHLPWVRREAAPTGSAQRQQCRPFGARPAHMKLCRWEAEICPFQETNRLLLGLS